MILWILNSVCSVLNWTAELGFENEGGVLLATSSAAWPAFGKQPWNTSSKLNVSSDCISLFLSSFHNQPEPLYFPQMTGTTQQNNKTPQVHIPAASAAANASVSVTLDPQAQLESDKRAVYRLVPFHHASPTLSHPTHFLAETFDLTSRWS